MNLRTIVTIAAITSPFILAVYLGTLPPASTDPMIVISTAITGSLIVIGLTLYDNIKRKKTFARQTLEHTNSKTLDKVDNNSSSIFSSNDNLSELTNSNLEWNLVNYDGSKIVHLNLTQNKKTFVNLSFNWDRRAGIMQIHNEKFRIQSLWSVPLSINPRKFQSKNIIWDIFKYDFTDYVGFVESDITKHYHTISFLNGKNYKYGRKIGKFGITEKYSTNYMKNENTIMFIFNGNLPISISHDWNFKSLRANVRINPKFFSSKELPFLLCVSMINWIYSYVSRATGGS